MRGKLFHNMIVQKTKAVFTEHTWQVQTECCIKKAGTNYYFDLLAIKGQYKVACEVETTRRHAIDNALKASIVDIPLWFIVPTRNIKNQIADRLKKLRMKPGNEPIKILLLDQLEQELLDYLDKHKIT